MRPDPYPSEYNRRAKSQPQLDARPKPVESSKHVAARQDWSSSTMLEKVKVLVLHSKRDKSQRLRQC